MTNNARIYHSLWNVITAFPTTCTLYRKDSLKVRQEFPFHALISDALYDATAKDRLKCESLGPILNKSPMRSTGIDNDIGGLLHDEAQEAANISPAFL